MATFSRLNDVEAVDQIVHIMHRLHEKLDAGIYLAIMSAYKSCSRYERAIQIFKSMLDGHILPFYTKIKCGEKTLQLRLFQKQVLMFQRALRLFIYAAGRTGQLEYALEVHRKLLDVGFVIFQPTVDDFRRTATTLLANTQENLGLLARITTFCDECDQVVVALEPLQDSIMEHLPLKFTVGRAQDADATYQSLFHNKPGDLDDYALQQFTEFDGVPTKRRHHPDIEAIPELQGPVPSSPTTEYTRNSPSASQEEYDMSADGPRQSINAGDIPCRAGRRELNVGTTLLQTTLTANYDAHVQHYIPFKAPVTLSAATRRSTSTEPLTRTAKVSGEDTALNDELTDALGSGFLGKPDTANQYVFPIIQYDPHEHKDNELLQRLETWPGEEEDDWPLSAQGHVSQAYADGRPLMHNEMNRLRRSF